MPPRSAGHSVVEPPGRRPAARGRAPVAVGDQAVE